MVNKLKRTESVRMQKNKEEIEYVESIWEQIPLVKVVCNGEIIGNVEWTDNIREWGFNSHYGVPISIGLTKLDDSTIVKVVTHGSDNSAELICNRCALQLIFAFGKYELIDRLGLRSIATEILENEDILYSKLGKEIYNSLIYGIEGLHEEKIAETGGK